MGIAAKVRAAGRWPAARQHPAAAGLLCGLLGSAEPRSRSSEPLHSPMPPCPPTPALPFPQPQLQPDTPPLLSQPACRGLPEPPRPSQAVLSSAPRGFPAAPPRLLHPWAHAFTQRLWSGFNNSTR